MLAGGVRGGSDVAWLQAVDRGDVDDRAAAVRQHGRDFVLHAQPHALEVHAHDFVPLCFGDVRHRRVSRPHDARVVDRAVQAAELLHRRLDHALDIRGAADISLDEVRLAARSDDSLHDLGALFGAPRGDDDLGALCSEFQRGGFAQARTSTGHQRDLARKHLHFDSPARQPSVSGGRLKLPGAPPRRLRRRVPRCHTSRPRRTRA